MRKFAYFLIAVTAIILTSCTKEITFDVPVVDSKFVIEGSLEQDKYPIVVVTKSAPYFDPVDSTTLANSIVMNAVVTVSDGTQSEQLTFGFDPTVYPFFVYKGSTLKGEAGKTYSLTVEVDGHTFTSETTVPEVLYLDSVWFALEAGKDSLGYCYGRGWDNGAVLDYYRVYTMRLHKDLNFIPIWGSVWDDKFFNGIDFTFIMPRGNASNLMEGSEGDYQEMGYFKIGDTVITRLCHIDRASYEFWHAAESETFSGGNPFTSTTTIPSNIQGGALGIWWGLGASYDTVVCKVNP